MRMAKAWQPIAEVLSGTSSDKVHGEMGVYQLADADEQVIFIGYAGGRSRFGLRGEISNFETSAPGSLYVRFEITTSYFSRYQELLMIHQADHGSFPVCNPPVPVGRLSPG
jgi:hypothetical protein